jgi:chromosome segregation ATPase
MTPERIAELKCALDHDVLVTSDTVRGLLAALEAAQAALEDKAQEAEDAVQEAMDKQAAAQVELAEALTAVDALRVVAKAAARPVFRALPCTCHQEDVSKWPCAVCELRDALAKTEEP